MLYQLNYWRVRMTYLNEPNESRGAACDDGTTCSTS